MFESNLSEGYPSNIRAESANDDASGEAQESEIVDGPPVNNPSNNEWREDNTRAEGSNHSEDLEDSYMGADGSRPGGENGIDKSDLDSEDATYDINQKIEGDNHGTVVGILNQTVRRMLDSHKLSGDFVRECASVYVKHSGIDLCLGILRRNRVVVLVGSQGIGRHTAAVWLLNELGEVRLREVRREPTEPFDVNDILGERKVGWILDLRSEDAHVADNLGRSLAGDEARDALEQAESYLIVIAKVDLWKKVGNGGRRLEFLLQKPNQEKVLNRHLQAGRKPLKEQHAALWSQNSNIAKELSKLTPAEVVDWSEDIRNEHSIILEQDSDYRKIPDENIENALEARTNWFDDLLDWFKKHQASERRNFILAAAVLEGCRAGDVYNESQNIASFLGEKKEDQAAGQQGPGIYELVSDSQAVLENGDHLSFPKSGYTRSVIEYFWVDRMHLRSNFIEWLVETSKKKGGDYDVATFERMGDYILRWCVQRRAISDLEKIISAWASNDKLRRSARDLLTASALDPALGKQVRDKMLAWVKSEDSADIDVQAVVADACGGPLGAVYEKMMLYRLGLLDKSSSPKVQEATENAFELLWNAEYSRPRLREAITRWLTGNERSRREAGRRSFVAIANVTNGFQLGNWPSEVSGKCESLTHIDEGELGFFVAGWRSVLEVNRTEQKNERAFCSWMDNALISRDYAAICLRVLQASLHAPSTDDQFSGSRIAALTRLLFVWAPTDTHDERAEIRTLVIDRAHRLDPMRQLESAPAYQTHND